MRGAMVGLAILPLAVGSTAKTGASGKAPQLIAPATGGFTGEPALVGVRVRTGSHCYLHLTDPTNHGYRSPIGTARTGLSCLP